MNLQALITAPLYSQFLAILYLWLLLCLCTCDRLILFWKSSPRRLGFTPFFSLVPIVVYSGPLFAPSTPSSSLI